MRQRQRKMLHSCVHVVLLVLLCSCASGDQESQESRDSRDLRAGSRNRRLSEDPRVWRECKLTLVSVAFFLVWVIIAVSTALPKGEKPRVPPPTKMAGSWAFRMAAHMNIVVMHFYSFDTKYPKGPMVSWFLPRANTWVPMFFVLSGFTAYVSSLNEVPSFTGSMALVGRRYQRYYPMAALGLFITWMAPSGLAALKGQPTLAVSTMLLGQSWVYPYFDMMINGPSWYLSNLIPLVALSPWLREKIQHSSRPFTLIAWLFVAMACMVKVANGLMRHEAEIFQYASYTIVIHWTIFVAGMVAARLFGDLASTGNRLVWRFAVMFTMVLYFTVVIRTNTTPDARQARRWVELVYLPPVFCLLMISMAFEQDYFMKLCARVPCESWLNSVAWCVYMIHVPLLCKFRDTVIRDLGIRHPLGLALLALIVSAVASKLLDEPLQARLSARRAVRQCERLSDPSGPSAVQLQRLEPLSSFFIEDGESPAAS